MKIIVYDDNPDFGGHQIMACHGIAALTSDASNEVICMLNPENDKFAAKLEEIETVQYVESPCTTHKLHGIRNRINRRRIHELARFFAVLKADIILCIQGDIEQSSMAPVAARNAGIPCISYIALPHRRAVMGSKFGKWRDQANLHLLNQPSSYIAISNNMASFLGERGVKQPITVVHNGIATPDSTFTPQASLARLGVLGRIEFKQRQQDFMVHAFCNATLPFEDCRLVIAGDGPDRGRLEHLIANCTRHAAIDLLPWQNDIDKFFASIDVLVIPSRYEGVPLVMLEALARGIPVIASDCDGMRETLPREWTFEPENANALAETFSAVRNNWQQLIAPLREKILQQHAMDTFKANFRTAVLQQ